LIHEVKLFDIKNDISESTDLSKIFRGGKLLHKKFINKIENKLDQYLHKVRALNGNLEFPGKKNL